MGDRWNAVAALVDPSRRALYEHVRRAGHPVNREEAADATRISRNLAAFHLDKLVDAGLLRARYQAPPDQPRGRGRTPKVYEPIDDGLSLTIPARRYELIAEILTDAIADDPTNALTSAHDQAHQRGQALGHDLRLADHNTDLVAVLDGLGFEPQDQSDRVRLANCPFHALAVRHTDLVCGLNHALLTGLVDGLDAHAKVELAPRPGACCVELTRNPQ